MGKAASWPILIRGTGTIGRPLIHLSLDIQKQLQVDEVIFHKYSFDEEFRGMLEDLIDAGAKLAVPQEKMGDFEKLLKPRGRRPSYTFEDAVERAKAIIDCTDKGIPRETKPYYESVLGNKIFITQGSENGFGTPYAFDINDQVLVPGRDRFLQVVSCNTHQVLCILKTLVFDPESTGTWNLENLVRARLYLGRRAADVSQKKSTIGVEVSVPAHALYGSHQAEDAMRVIRTMTQIELDVHTAADIYNNPFMHVVYYDVWVRERVTKDEIQRRIRQNPLAAITYKSTNNETFYEGFERGRASRIINQTVFVGQTVEVLSGGHEIIGRCFTPQDGNSLLSSIAAVLWFKDPALYKQKLRDIFYKRPYLFDEV